MARPTIIARRPICVFIAASCVATSLLLSGCGGGTDVAPPTPLVDGNGFAQATFDGVSRGETEIVSAVVAGASTRPVTVVGEAAQFPATGVLMLANRPMTLTPVTVTGPGGPYSQGVDEATCTADPTCQFWVEDYNAGVLGRNPTASSPIPTAVPLSVNYEWSETLQSIQVSVTYGNLGEDIRIWVHNIARTETGPFTVTVQSTGAPADGSKAFDAQMNTGMLEPTGQKSFGVVADPGNRLDITGVDLSNSLAPCIQGHLVTAMTDTLNPDPANPNHLDCTFDDSDC